MKIFVEFRINYKSSMLERKTRKNKTEFLQQISVLSHHSRKHKSLVASQFSRDILFEVMASALVLQLSEKAVEQSEYIRRAQQQLQNFVQSQHELMSPLLNQQPDFLFLSREKEDIEPLPELKYTVQNKFEGPTISSSWSQQERQFSIAQIDNLPNPKQMMNKLKKEYLGKLKLGKENAQAFPLNDLIEGDNQLSKTLRVIKKYTMGLDSGQKEQNKLQEKPSRDDEFVYDSDAKPLRVRRFETQMSNSVHKKVKIIKAEPLTKNLISNPKMELLKHKHKASVTQHNVSTTLNMSGGRLLGQEAQNAIAMSFRIGHKGVKIRQPTNKSVYTRSRVSVVKLPKIPLEEGD